MPYTTNLCDKIFNESVKLIKIFHTFNLSSQNLFSNVYFNWFNFYYTHFIGTR